MAHRDDDSGEYALHSTKRSNTPLLVVLGVAGVLVLLCGGATAAGFLWTRNAVDRMHQREREDAEYRNALRWAKVWPSLDELSREVKGKSAGELTAVMGEPDGTDGHPEQTVGRVRWTYRNKLREGNGGEAVAVEVVFQDRHVVTVTRAER